MALGSAQQQWRAVGSFGLLGCLLGLALWLGPGRPARGIPLGEDASQPEAHWAFRPLGHPEPPPVAAGEEAGSPVDSFVLHRLEAAGLKPAPRATRLALLRRAYFDLVGLPPPPDEVESFAADERPDAFERLVDRLLQSPQYGERWGRHWLDVVRYADTGGFEADLLYPRAWRFRDYVIRSLNDDKPFDRFIQEQVAGDELWPESDEARDATALYCVGPALAESAMVTGQLESEWLTDAADTTGAAFLGLTLGCARCHDHKYDPISQRDYYAMQAIFAASDRPFPGKVKLNRVKALNGLLSDAPVPKSVQDDPRCDVKTDDEVGFHLFHREHPLPVRLLRRGELSKPREAVEPELPAALRAGGERPDFAQVAPDRRRAALARWLTSAQNPLTARVLVNRVWGWHFGQGLVRTPNDFGTQGDPPSHPELLDWLARDFVEHGWSLKHLHRRIMRSRTYQMQSAAAGPGLKADPENRLLWHFPRQRLEGEAIRDSMLACAGTLNRTPFGPPVVPPLSAGELTGLFDAKGKWPVTKDRTEHTRRSVYLLVRRTFVYPMFAAFDPPELMASCPRRQQTTVPTQALTLLNSPVAREQAEQFAHRLLKECGRDAEALVARAWLLAFGRPITAAESARAREFLGQHTGAAPADDAAASPCSAARVARLCLALFNANELLYVD